MLKKSLFYADEAKNKMDAYKTCSPKSKRTDRQCLYEIRPLKSHVTYETEIEIEM